MTDRADIEALFDSYLSRWNARDFPRMASLFTEPTIYMTESGPLPIASRQEMEAMFRNKFAELDDEGFDHTEIGGITVSQCDAKTAFLEMNQVRRLRSDGSAMDELDAIYVCSKTPEGWRFAVVIGAWLDWRQRSEFLGKAV
ncbi:MAG: nuclear transport factor 2 family protein [Tateyamaria sp.]|jgi:uncharacterized protein (TIGR02246 family)|uniref:YybH family protein n=2 Tax=Tateyamaria sp. TaxID=1929288 RepID=UPI0032DD6C31